MMRIATIPVLATAILCCAPVAAAQYLFTATLSGAKEVPSNTSAATGTISVIADDMLSTLAITESWSGLSSQATGAHIHCCASATATAPIVVPFTNFPTTTGGSYSATLLFAPSSATPTFASLLAGMQAGQAYANIHNANFPGGEIRGQLVAGGVPEPAGWATMVMGFGVIGAAMRRRRYRLASR